MTLKGCTKAELLWLIDWMCTHSMFWHDIEIERALNALELEREQKKLDEADQMCIRDSISIAHYRRNNKEMTP